MMTLKDMIEEALAVQDACNLSGVVHSFSRLLNHLWEEARRQGKATEWVNTHSIVRAFVSKLICLSRYDVATDRCFEELYKALDDMKEGAQAK